MNDTACPERVFTNCGDGFLAGFVGGSVQGAWRLVRYHVINKDPQVVLHFARRRAAECALYGLLYTAFECSLESVRRSRDTFNSILAATLTGATRGIRAGHRVAVFEAAKLGIALASVEAVGIYVNRMFPDVKTRGAEHVDPGIQSRDEDLPVAITPLCLDDPREVIAVDFSGPELDEEVVETPAFSVTDWRHVTDLEQPNQ